ncbi:MAG: hypothetical protein HC803_01035 [Saprospiraceae bacterium]|nr:hypothetical protein [Saprospiraceae bacterium]
MEEKEDNLVPVQLVKLLDSYIGRVEEDSNSLKYMNLEPEDIGAVYVSVLSFGFKEILK